MNQGFELSETARVKEISSGSRILVADDDCVIREVAGANLEAQGFVVSLARNGLEMLEQFEIVRPDLLLLDVEMPELDGFRACERLRTLPDGETVPVIMMTGRDDIEAVERAFEAQATDFISKPINWTVLVQRMRYILRAAKAFSELKRNQLRLIDAQKMANLGYWDWKVSEEKLYLSEQAAKIVGYPAESVQSAKDHLRLVHKEDRAFVREQLNAKVFGGEPWLLEYRVLTPAGEVKYIRNTGQISASDGEQKPSWFMGTVLDVTEQRSNEETIRKMAFYDVVTGLHNRTAFMEELKLLLNLHQRMGTMLAVLYLDLDDFKRVNDSMGHHIGDHLLKQFADRLTSALRSSDVAARGDNPHVAARLGGDEFTLLLSGLKGRNDAAIVARRILGILERPFSLEMKVRGVTKIHEIYIGASIGVAVYPNDGEDADELLKNADTAMYAAKRGGKNTFRFYVDEMNYRALEQIDMESSLRGALDNNEFSLDYQPQVDLRSGRVVGVEALLRWETPELGAIEPEIFIPLAENSGQITAISAWVLETVCTQIKQWQRQGLPAFRVAVNLSSLQFRHSQLETLVKKVLKESGVEPELLELELTESIMTDDVDRGIATLEALRAMGVKVSIDDFGTGCSSLTYLQRFPIDSLKIDRSFVRSLEDDGGGAALVNAIIVMGKSLGFAIVAEGVEEQVQLEFLREKGCDIAQGFLFSRPMGADQLLEFIENFDFEEVLSPRT